jgi:site-specific DNA-methyltransferase (adenine-specific)
MINPALFSSATDLWATPQDLFDELDYIFHFTLDPCATPENTKCRRYFTKEDDGLAQDWGTHRVWMNPPYGDPEQPCKPNCKKKQCQKACEKSCRNRCKEKGLKCCVKKRGHCITEYRPGIVDWMRKAYEASLGGALVVCLVPARVDTGWWNDWAKKGSFAFIPGRLKFGESKDSAPFPSAIVIFWPPAVGFLAG